MGKIGEQESEVTPLSRQMQVVGSHATKIPTSTVINPGIHLKKEYMDCLIVSGNQPKQGYTKPTNNFFEQEMLGSFPDYSPPLVGVLYNSAYSDTDEIFLRSLNGDSSTRVNRVSNYIDLIKAKGMLKKCPGGQHGGASGGNSSSYNTSTGTTNTGNGSWVVSGSYGGGISGGMGGGAGDGDDENPWNNHQQNSGPAPEMLFDEEEFHSFDYLDDALIADILQTDLFRDFPLHDNLVLSTTTPLNVGFYRDVSYNSYTQSSEPSDPPSTPAPLTPLTPKHPTTPIYMQNPATPSYVQNPATSHSLPKPLLVQTSCTQPSDISDMQDLLDIQKLMIQGPGKTGHNMSHTTTTLVPQPSSMPIMPAYPNTLLHQTLSQTSVPSPAMTSRQPQNNVIDFLATNTITTDKCHVIELFVPNNAPQDKRGIGYRALEHCYKMDLEYRDALKNTTFSELPVAVREIAQLCEMELSNNGEAKLHFKMPKTCVSLNRWMSSDHSVDKRQIVLQQLINTLTILFKAQNNLCFWGSSEIWVDTNLRVYLFVDFIKALAIQKDYADQGLLCNPRVEDCKVLSELYQTMLKPFLQKDLTWISPHLNRIFKTFEDFFKNPENCASNMAYIARVFGERRICKLQCSLIGSFQYTIYCAEHEPISESLAVLAGVLPSSVARWWAVVRSHDNYPVGITDMATKETEGMYNLFPIAPNVCNMLPGALYIESKQCL